VTDPVPALTKWQERRRRGRSLEHRVMAILFAMLVIAVVVYFGGLARLVAPVLVE
jgi:hypothetical protein